jgi:ABC-2 type transport system permease protein
VKKLLAVAAREFRRVFELRAAFSALIVAVAIYAVMYPQPYVNEFLRRLPIAVVDQDGTETSREFIRRVDATSDVAVVYRFPDMATAEREVFARRIEGVLLIPENFERELLHGHQSAVALYGDASYFLVFQRISGAVSVVAQTVGAKVEAQRLVDIGVDPVIAGAATNPMPLTSVPIFNPEAGYATYILPGALVLILQQTLLIGVCLLGTSPGADFRKIMADPPSEMTVVLGKLIAYMLLEAVVVPTYLVVLPYLYGLPRLGSVWAIIVFAVPFVFAVSGLGMLLASLFRTPLTAQLSVAAVGLPFLMMSGFTWPVEMMPDGIRLLAKFVPSTSAIIGFVELSQLGAPLSFVRPQLLTLIGLGLAYCTLAVVVRARVSVRDQP